MTKPLSTPSLFRNGGALLAAVLCAAVPTRAQEVLAEAAFVEKAISTSQSIKAGLGSVQQQSQLLRGAVTLPNPEVFIESPTGTFYTPSVTQSLEWPSVYVHQRRLQKARIGVAQGEQAVTVAEARLGFRRLYLDYQYLSAQAAQYRLQDSLYDGIRQSAIRQFAAGQIDYLQQLFAETQWGEAHARRVAAEKSLRQLAVRIQYLTAGTGNFLAAPLTKRELPPALLDSLAAMDTTANPGYLLALQNERVAAEEVRLQRSRALPGLAFGYFNQGDRDTKLKQRFRFGFTIPVYFWQYRNNIQAARIGLQVSQARTRAYRQGLTLQYVEALGDLDSNASLLAYYESTGVPKAGEMLQTAQRLFSAGQTTYTELLRNNTEAYNIQARSLEALYNYNSAILTLQYLTGTP